jgi:hypothetical protein
MNDLENGRKLAQCADRADVLEDSDPRPYTDFSEEQSGPLGVPGLLCTREQFWNLEMRLGLREIEV